MPHIPLDENLPGITGLLNYRQDTALPIRQLTQILLRGESALTEGERELIATVTSQGNQCKFCTAAHSAAADAFYGESTTTELVKNDPTHAPVSEKMKHLLEIARRVQADARTVSTELVEKARHEGATDREIHDTVLIAALFCLYNKYVDGLASVTPTEPAFYDRLANILKTTATYHQQTGMPALTKLNKMKKTKPSLFWWGIVLLLVPGLAHAYLLMPFPGSQELNAITVSYYLEKIVLPLRILGAVMIIWYLAKYFTKNSRTGKIVKISVLVLCLASYYFTDVMFKAESMFEEPQTVKFANAIDNKVPARFVVIGVVNNGVAKAYPVDYLAYHHKVQDDVGGMPVLVTFCSMCRTGRVYSPIINGARQQFRLVGARHYNAVIEDQSTKTWWYQATGLAAAGKLKGQHLQELPYEQSTLESWLDKHPTSLVLQPDKHYTSDYADLKNYDRVQSVDRDSTLKNKDSLMRRSWMLGVIVHGQAKAYDWRRMVKKRLLNDQVATAPVLLTIEDDSLTYHAFNSRLKGQTLHFKLDTAGNLTDQETDSVWDWDGLATSGSMKGSQLTKIQAYQEYWHSWKHFHPNTLFWKE